MAGAELSEDELDDLDGKIVIGGVDDDTIEDDFDVEFFQLKFYTYQPEDNPNGYKYYLKVTVELEDKKTDTIGYAQFARLQGGVDDEYTGTDRWKFEIEQGDMKRPKVTAYVIQYGILDEKDGKPDFVVLAEELDDVDSLEELIERTPNRFEQKPKIIHEYDYIDADGSTQTFVE
jgi:hypothetical protein